MMSFRLEFFKNCEPNDSFFESLKNDYPGFEAWFQKKSDNQEKAYVHRVDSSIQAFLYVKDYEEEVVGNLPAKPRMKIGTMKICDTSKGKRLGEGAVGIALWRWQQSDLDEIYVTVFPKHEELMGILKTYGFAYAGKKGQEDIYLKDKKKIDYSDPKKSFPYISPKFKRGGYIPIKDVFHDKMFQYSELKNVPQTRSELSVSNGITKAYISNGKPDYVAGDFVFAYRMYTGTEYSKSFKSAVTSFCTVTKVIVVKENGKTRVNFDDFCDMVGNKTVYSEEELEQSYSKPNVCIIEMIYNGYFGAGNNVNLMKLNEKGLWGDDHPYIHKITRDQSIALLNLGGKNVCDIIVD